MELVERHAITVFMECCVILLERFSTDDALGIGIYSRIFCVVKPDQVGVGVAQSFLYLELWYEYPCRNL